MKNNVINITELYSSIRTLFIRKMPYTLTPSEIVQDFLQGYAGTSVQQQEANIKLYIDKIVCSGDGIDYVKNHQFDVFGAPMQVIKFRTALSFEGEPEQCRSLCKDVDAMVKWLLQEEYIVECGPNNKTEYRMTFKFSDRTSFQ